MLAFTALLNCHKSSLALCESNLLNDTFIVSDILPYTQIFDQLKYGLVFFNMSSVSALYLLSCCMDEHPCHLYPTMWLALGMTERTINSFPFPQLLSLK